MNIRYLRRTLAIARVVGLSLLLSACAGAHLHNPKNSETANTAVESFASTKAEIDAEFEKQTENQLAIMGENLAAVESFADNDRDAALVIVSTSDEAASKVWKEEMFEQRIKQIGIKGEDQKEYGGNISAIANLRRGSEELRASLYQREISLKSLRYTGDLVCTAEKAAPPIREEVLSAFLKAEPKEDRAELEGLIRKRYAEYADACKKLRGGTDIAQYFDDDGEFKKVLADLNETRKDEKEAKQKVAEVKALFKEATMKLEDEKPDQSDKKPSEVIEIQAKKLREIVTDASSLLAALSGESSIVKERLNAIDQVLAAVANGSNKAEEKEEAELEGTTKRVAMVLAGLPNLANSFSDLSQTLNRPPLTALIMAKGELQARLTAIEAGLARERARIALINEKYNALIDELNAYNKVVRLINTANKSGGSPFDKSYQSLMASTKDPDKQQQQRVASAAIALQLQAEYRSLRRRFQAEYRMIALDYQATNEVSKARVAQWNAMLTPLIGQQKAYHDSGMKREQIASLAVELLKALGLFAIASGVN